jgi:hypothetical protein
VQEGCLHSIRPGFATIGTAVCTRLAQSPGGPQNEVEFTGFAARQNML